MLDWLRRLRKRESDWRDSLGRDISTPEMRRQARRHYYWIDHGILRVYWTAFRQIAPGAYRANQPSAARLEQWQRDGIKTVLNLRGIGNHSPYLFERETCDRLGLKLIDLRLYADDLASREKLLSLIATLRDIEKPFVMHCKSGSDRTGFAAILYRHVVLGQPLEDALSELSWRYFHFKRSKNGILDLFFETYLAEGPAMDQSLEAWIADGYDRDAIRREWAGRRGRG